MRKLNLNKIQKGDQEQNESFVVVKLEQDTFKWPDYETSKQT